MSNSSPPESPSALPDDAGRRSKRSLLRSPRVVAWALSEATSAFGDQFLIVALAAAAALQHGAAVAGLVLAAGAVPRAVLAVFGGTVVDRIGPKTAMLTADLARLAILAVAAASVAFTGPTVTLLVIVAVTTGVFGALFEPASIAIAPMLVDDDELVALSSLRLTLGRSAMLIGAPTAGVVLAAADVRLAFAVDAGSFLVSTVGIWVLRPRLAADDDVAGEEPGDHTSSDGERRKKSVFGETAEGLRYVWRHPFLRPALLTVAGVEFALTGAVNTGLPVLTSVHNWGPQGIGFLLAGFGGGSMVGPLLAPLLARRRRALLVGLIVAAAGALGFAGAVTVSHLGAAVMLTFALGVAISLLAAQLLPAVQQACDPGLIGRVGGLMTVALTGSAPLSIAAVGLLSSVAGVRPVVAGAAAIAAAFCLIAITSRPMREGGAPDRAPDPSQTRDAATTELAPTQVSEATSSSA